MPEFKTEIQEGYHPVTTDLKENGQSYGHNIVYPQEHKTASSKAPFELNVCVKCKLAHITLVSLILNLAMIISLVSLSVRPREPSPALPTWPVVSCPNSWVGYQEKCYYFAKAEENWTFSKRYCSSLNASLAVVDSQEEMDFMMRYKGSANHWIGLQRNLNQSWTWVNGTILNGWFTILGGGSCAYMNRHSIASSSCSSKEYWICSKPVVK